MTYAMALAAYRRAPRTRRRQILNPLGVKSILRYWDTASTDARALALSLLYAPE